jgi:hydrogenase-1 operon protein HyaF
VSVQVTGWGPQGRADDPPRPLRGFDSPGQAGSTRDRGIQAQESVFAGIWRVLVREGGVVVRDCIEVGPFPQAAVAAARTDGRPLPPLPAVHPAGTMNAPAVLAELRDRSTAWLADPDRTPSHVVNLTLLPLAPADSEYFEDQLGRGRVLVLSRGYGNCRIANTRGAGIWRVTYFNSSDAIILDTLEVGGVPEVALAARQDLEDSAERLAEVLQWLRAS